jgi:cell division protein FtsW (lipid II flippase)
VNSGFRAPFSTAIAIGFGFLILLGLFVPDLADLRNRILNWVILLAAMALLLGLVNLFQVHYQRVRNREKAVYSAVLIVAMAITFTVTLLQSSTGSWANWIFNYLLVPVETSLMAVLAISLTLAAARVMQQRTDLMNIVFIVTLLVLLISAGPLFGVELPYFTRIVGPYVNNVLATGAMRGLLIGVALGTITTGLRILIGADRPYGG